MPCCERPPAKTTAFAGNSRCTAVQPSIYWDRKTRPGISPRRRRRSRIYGDAVDQPDVCPRPRRAVQEMKSCGAVARRLSSARSRPLTAGAKSRSVSRSCSMAIAVWCSGPALPGFCEGACDGGIEDRINSGRSMPDLEGQRRSSVELLGHGLPALLSRDAGLAGAQHVLLHLARRCLRQLVDEADPLRCLEVGERTAYVQLQFVLRRQCVPPQNDESVG